MSDKLFMFFQHTLPKRVLTEFLGKLANIKGGKLTSSFIKYFIKKYGVNMNEAVHSDPYFYKINNDQIFQAKGKSFTTAALLGGDAFLANQFENGIFATLYLSPKDYHRIHMPCDGFLKKMVYVPGDLYSVNPLTARSVDQLYARNERVVCLFEGESGPFVLVLVGATVVGSMRTSWHGVINSPRLDGVTQWTYDGSLKLEKGQEMGQFLLGSTVVMLFPESTYDFVPEWQPERSIRLGEAMAHRKEVRQIANSQA